MLRVAWNSSAPTAFETRHVYLAESSDRRLSNLRTESVRSILICTLSVDSKRDPFFNHSNVKGGDPCEGTQGTPILSPGFKPLLNSKGVILGGAVSDKSINWWVHWNPEPDIHSPPWLLTGTQTKVKRNSRHDQWMIIFWRSLFDRDPKWQLLLLWTPASAVYFEHSIFDERFVSPEGRLNPSFESLDARTCALVPWVLDPWVSIF